MALQFCDSTASRLGLPRMGAWISPANDTMTDVADIRARLKRVIVSSLMLEGLTPEEIIDEEPLFGEGLGLDSVDALELVLGIEREFGIKIGNDEMDRSAFSTVESLGAFVQKIQASQGVSA